MNRFQEIEFYNTPDCEVMIKPKGDPVRVLAETGYLSLLLSPIW